MKQAHDQVYKQADGRAAGRADEQAGASCRGSWHIRNPTRKYNLCKRFINIRPYEFLATHASGMLSNRVIFLPLSAARADSSCTTSTSEQRAGFLVHLVATVS